MVGRKLLHYEIVERLGEGGMGVVYKARDTHLDRFVALKFLPADKVADPERRARFVQEAKAASALRHPNIVTVYDIACGDGHDFIAMEYVAGKTLDQLIGRRGLKLSDAVRYGIQIADALAQAHAARIVHRDLKPSNIMVDEQGSVRVLDFGLAKLTETVPGDDAPTMTMRPKTEEGTIVGTAAYMSPEQAQGKPLDARSDIFSFGAVLYEMLTGRRAFAGDTKISTLAAILNQEPKPATQLVPELPREVERIVARCLRKDPARRYQNTDDLRLALEELKEESDSGRLAPVAVTSARRNWVMLTAAACVLVLVAATVLWRLLPRRAPVSAPSLIAVPLTSYPGSETHPTFSPDGNQVAFSWDGQKQENVDIYVKVIDSPNALRLTKDPAPDIAPAWSPDGRHIAFIRRSDDRGSVFVISPLGGPERRVKATHAIDVGWMPDSTGVIVSDRDSEGEPFALYSVSLASNERTRLTNPPRGELGDLQAASSPDGSKLAFYRQYGYSGGFLDIWVRERGVERRIYHQLGFISGLAWAPNSSDVLFANTALWRVPAAGGAAERIPNLPADPNSPAISRPLERDGNLTARLAFEHGTYDSNLWRVDLTTRRGTSNPRRIAYSTLAEYDPAISPDGRHIAFASARAGVDEIWISDSDGANPVQLSSVSVRTALGGAAMPGTPRWAPDARMVAFDGVEGSTRQVYTIPLEGGGARRLTEGARPFWSADGHWIYFRSNRSGSNQIWKLPSDGGAALQVTRGGAFDALESLDGSTLFFTRTGTKAGLWRKSLPDGEEQLIQPDIKAGLWSVAEPGIFFLDPGWLAAEPGIFFLAPIFPAAPVPVRLFDPTTGQVRTVTSPSMRVTFQNPSFSVSRDGTWAVYASADSSESDLMLVENFR